jgi:leader peptidase (prepilin peptidase)/N-methyltransferase
MRCCVTEDLPVGVVVFFAALLGLVLGSFLNVCISRWGAEPRQSVVRPRSRCPRCGASLHARDNIPVISWLLLRGKCRACGLPISPMYPLIELATALLWGGMVWCYGPTLAAVTGAVFFSILLGIAMTDLRSYIIPDEFTLGGLVIGLALAAMSSIDSLIWSGIGAGAGFVLLWLVAWLGLRIFRKEAMGGGDIKMMAMVGTFVGWHGVLLTIFLGALLGTIIFVPINLINRDKLVPFGIFLAVGAAATWLFGTPIIDWYRAYTGL